MYVCFCVRVTDTAHVWKAEDSFSEWPALSTFTWVQRIKPRRPGLCGKQNNTTQNNNNNKTHGVFLLVQSDGGKDGHSGQAPEIFRKSIKLLDMWMGESQRA